MKAIALHPLHLPSAATPSLEIKRRRGYDVHSLTTSPTHSWVQERGGGNRALHPRQERGGANLVPHLLLPFQFKDKLRSDDREKTEGYGVRDCVHPPTR